MAPGSTGTQDEDAKDLLDKIGQQVHDEIVKNDVNDFRDDLKGNLQAAKGIGELAGTTDTCNLVQEYYGRDDNSNRYPCGTGKEERFSDKQGAECATSKIKDSKNYRGACAPYRRLHLCHHNLETINNTTSMTTTSDTLLAEVCMAAKYEGQSIKTHYTPHQEKYKNTGTASQLCTVLARSFADIGDIVRGRDLYRGDNREKTKLESKLKEIFAKIHSEVTSGKNKDTLKTRYKDKNGGNFFKLREDWWTANRSTIWEAITCDDDDKKLRDASYFRATCSMNGSGAQDNNKCRCEGANVVPTYFDYVPQYLRWFEEWAEDFCRKRKHKLENAIDKCRGDGKGGKKLYCDLNRHDCVKTIRGDHIFVERTECDDCSVACKPFVKWIDKQKVEFDKQKRKYEKEITGGVKGRNRKKRDASTTKYDGYESKFYDILKKKGGYQNVETFLEKLSKEGICQSQPTVGNQKASKVDFTNGKYLETFSHTEICQACPWCGVKEEKVGGKWKAKDDETCGDGKKYADYENTQIPILTGDKTKGDMVKKYKKFCNGNGGNGAPGTATSGAPGEKGASGKNGDNITETWECYYKKKEKDGGKDINFCVQQKQENDGKKEYSMHYNAFFWDWVYHMLHDSLEWRKQLGSCINNNSNGNTCKNKHCKDDCGCFQKWVVKKKRNRMGKCKKTFLQAKRFDRRNWRSIYWRNS
ncbi:hypothetical protein PFAG_06155 [Plasmodium falciparum Santa Lucia]|uniref:Plasmodium falciparum erythrocyte membrane protein-1 N-terminal segment domain-containing protein n=1 Tax=Plasmodium falciparum Santa Lucia TaxID=478859 RepID=W7FKI2_PLAFA|nr:hypothetical protein PFAG_06155 [Plasmodium falciparum Santa Lucia]